MIKKSIALVFSLLLILPASAVLFCDDSEAGFDTEVTFKNGEYYNLKSGTYEYHSSRSGISLICYSTGNNLNFSIEGTIAIPTSGVYYVSGSEGTISFNNDPRVPESPATPTEQHTTHSAKAWLKAEVGSGTYRTSSGQMYALETGSEDQVKFEREVVAANVTDFVAEKYNAKELSSSFVALSGNYTLYTVYDVKYGGHTQNIDIRTQVDPTTTNYTSLSFRVVNDEWYSFYVSAYKTFTIAASYSDVSKLYLCGSDGTVYQIESGHQYSITTKAGTNYYLNADTSTMKNVEVYLSVSGASQPDNLGTVFAGFCVLVCAIIFGILFVSGRKPGWAKKD